jgi:hypothetical protein
VTAQYDATIAADTPLDLCNMRNQGFNEAEGGPTPIQHTQPTLTSQQQETVGVMKVAGSGNAS